MDCSLSCNSACQLTSPSFFPEPGSYTALTPLVKSSRSSVVTVVPVVPANTRTLFGLASLYNSEKESER